MINDIKNLKDSGGASIGELREFLKTLKARNPQEVIGIVSTSLLVQSLVISCLATAVLLAVFTVGPYVVYGPPRAQAAAGKPARPAAAASAEPASPAAAQPAETAAAATADTPDPEKTAKALGLDEVKQADPKKNPLDKPDLDKLLDGL